MKFSSKFYHYKSKTELRFVYIISFKRNTKAKVKYNAKDKPTVTKEMYIKNNLTFKARIPNLSASLEETANPWRSK